MSYQRSRTILANTALSNLHKHHGLRRSQSANIGLTPKSIRVVVLGCGGVGKTAMSVRFVTERFIGDYDPTLESIYRHSAVVDDQLVNFEIMDTAGQEENSLLLEDKCKWGESFIFVYDVTDKYSFDELSRLKFIASYTHSKMRLNFTPCWILVGNKADLADRDRMVTTEEGRALARDLGCHVFREISVKESTTDACEIFEDVWRGFTKDNPRLPSSAQRRKCSYRIQHKVPVISSNAARHVSDILETILTNGDANGYLACNLTHDLIRQKSAPIVLSEASHVYNMMNNKEQHPDNFRTIDSIPEDADECECNVITSRSRTVSDSLGQETVNRTNENKNLMPSLARCKALSKRMSSSLESIVSSFDSNRSSSSGTSTPVTGSTSPSSSNSSLNESSSYIPSYLHVKAKSSDGIRNSNISDIPRVSRKRRDSIKPDDLMVSMYHEHCRRNRAR